MSPEYHFHVTLQISNIEAARKIRDDVEKTWGDGSMVFLTEDQVELLEGFPEVFDEQEAEKLEKEAEKNGIPVEILGGDSFGSQLRDSRERRNLTVTMLADMSNVSRKAITLWEKGHTLPQTLEIFGKTINAMEIDPQSEEGMRLNRRLLWEKAQKNQRRENA